MNRSTQILTGFVFGLSIALAGAASAAVSISLDAEKLVTDSGSAMPTSGLLLLVVSTEDGSFGLPTAEAFLPDTGDDVVLASWDLSDGGNVAGVFSGLASNLNYDGGMDAGDPLMLYWFPGSTKNSTGPGEGARYGLYRDADGIMTGTAWVLPAEGSLLYSLKFLTDTATLISENGGLPGYAGSAALALGVDLAPVNAPTGVAAKDEKDDGVRISWTDAANNESGYLIERALAGSGVWMAIGSALADATSFLDGTATQKTRYEYRVTATNAVESSIEVVSAALLTSFGRMANISTRGQVLTGASIMIGGFVVEGSQDKRLLIRAIGPQLGAFGVPGALANPSLEIYRSGETVPMLTNIDWGENANADEIRTVTELLGGFALEEGGQDSVLLVSLPPGGYTANVKGVDGMTGVGLVEIYDADDPEEPADVINISTRGNVGTDADILIAGFVIAGDRSQTVLVRGIGPTLATFGVTDTIADPSLQILENVGGVFEDVAENDNWGDAANLSDIPGVTQQVGAFALEPGSGDAVVLVTLPPGAYTANLSGVAGTTGNALVEVYRVP